MALPNRFAGTSPDLIKRRSCRSLIWHAAAASFTVSNRTFVSDETAGSGSMGLL